MLYRHKDGSYTGSSLDGEVINVISKADGDVSMRRIFRGKGWSEEEIIRFFASDYEGHMPDRTTEPY